MKTTKLFLALVVFVAMGMVMAGCSAEVNDDAAGGSKTYKYTAAQPQEIADLQEEYGVKLNSFATESDEPLPTVEEMKNLVAMIAEMQGTLAHTTSRGENRLKYSNDIKRNHLMMVSPELETYKGSHTGSTSNYTGSFSYTISWNFVGPKNDNGTFNLVHEEYSVSGWDVSYLHWHHYFVGSNKLGFTISYCAVPSGKVNPKNYFDISGTCEL